MRYFSLAAAVLWCGLGFCQNFGSGKREYRSVNTSIYEVSVQRNGRVDVTLASGAPVFDNAFPMVELEGENKPEPLAVAAGSTEREPVTSVLGAGHAIRFLKGNCEWVIQSFPTQPFFTVQAAFMNTGKKAVKVKALYPFVVGEPRKGSASLGRNTGSTIVLDNGPATEQQARLREIAAGAAESAWYLPAVNPASGRILVAGFLTNLKALTSVALVRSEESSRNEADSFWGRCLYDPPVEVAPGGRLESEVMYISVGDDDSLQALERFGQAVAAFNGVAPRRAALPHGWDSWNTRYHTKINEKNMLAELDFVDKHLKRYGWTHFSLDDGWQLGRGNWEADPEKFPHGMKWFADQVHARGMTAGIWTDPFTVDLDSPLAKKHPDWLIEAGGIGREMIGENQRLLDVTKPQVYAQVVNLYRKIGQEWGYDALVEADFVYRLLFAEGYARDELTRVEVFRLGMRAVTEGFGEGAGKFLMSTPPLSVNGTIADGLRIGNDCAPIWQKSPDRWPWGCVESLTNAAHRYFFAPHLWAPDQDCAYFSRPAERARWGVTDQPELTFEQSVAWLTGAALTGGVVKIGNAFTDLKPREVEVLRRLLPVSSLPARPVDIFARPHPAIWSLPVRTQAGDWSVVGVFNWDAEKPATIPVSFAALGLAKKKRYTVYDFWGDTFYGTAKDRLNVHVGPGAVRLLGLRPYENRPMFLSTDRHWSMGATDFRKLEWDGDGRKLRGVFAGIENTDYNLRVLVPAPWNMQYVNVSCGPAEVEMDDETRVLKIGFHCEEAGEVTWEAGF